MDAKLVVRRSARARSRRQLLLGMGFGAVALVIMLLLLASPALAPAPSFPDVPTTHPYYAAVSDLAGRAIIGGYANGNFGPDDAVIRQQFAKMIVLTLGLPVSEADICPFTDVDPGAPGVLYPDHYVAVAAAHNITVGTSPGLFSPGISIKRAQVVTMVVRAAQSVAPSALATPPLGYQGTLGDFDTTHAGNLKIAEYNDLLTGLEGFGTAWDPFASATRGEVAQILHNLLGTLPGPTTTTTALPAKAITAFSFQGLTPPVTGTITEATHTIALTVPHGTTVTALVATFTTSGVSVRVGTTAQVSGTTPNNFTDPVTYTVTAADTSTQNYVVTVTVAADLAIGDSYQGGKVAYILQSGDPGYVAGETHGLISAVADQSAGISWCNMTQWDKEIYITTGATGTALGTGFANTNTIIAAQGPTATSYAAGLARAYDGGSYADWYLPSKDELNKLHLNQGAIGGSWLADYWSSSENTFDTSDSRFYAWFQVFSQGFQDDHVFKSDMKGVRAIRAF